MNVEKLRRLQAQVRIGGKGTPRRKKKVIHQSAATDDKKLQSSLKKLSVSTIPGIEEVNIIKDDLTVIHFNNPKAQASLSANTFAVTGHGETKKIVEMLPEILPQLGQDTVTQLRMFANTMAGTQKPNNIGSNPLDSVVEDDEVPLLVNDFEEVAKMEECKSSKPKFNEPSKNNTNGILTENNMIKKVDSARDAADKLDKKSKKQQNKQQSANEAAKIKSNVGRSNNKQQKNQKQNKQEKIQTATKKIDAATNKQINIENEAKSVDKHESVKEQEIKNEKSSVQKQETKIQSKRVDKNQQPIEKQKSAKEAAKLENKSEYKSQEKNSNKPNKENEKRMENKKDESINLEVQESQKKMKASEIKELKGVQKPQQTNQSKKASKSKELKHQMEPEIKHTEEETVASTSVGKKQLQHEINREKIESISNDLNNVQGMPTQKEESIKHSNVTVKEQRTITTTKTEKKSEDTPPENKLVEIETQNLDQSKEKITVASELIKDSSNVSIPAEAQKEVIIEKPVQPERKEKIQEQTGLKSSETDHPKEKNIGTTVQDNKQDKPKPVGDKKAQATTSAAKKEEPKTRANVQTVQAKTIKPASPKPSSSTKPVPTTKVSEKPVPSTKTTTPMKAASPQPKTATSPLKKCTTLTETPPVTSVELPVPTTEVKVSTEKPINIEVQSKSTLASKPAQIKNAQSKPANNINLTTDSKKAPPAKQKQSLSNKLTSNTSVQQEHKKQLSPPKSEISKQTSPQKSNDIIEKASSSQQQNPLVKQSSPAKQIASTKQTSPIKQITENKPQIKKSSTQKTTVVQTTQHQKPQSKSITPQLTTEQTKDRVPQSTPAVQQQQITPKPNTCTSQTAIQMKNSPSKLAGLQQPIALQLNLTPTQSPAQTNDTPLQSADQLQLIAPQADIIRSQSELQPKSTPQPPNDKTTPPQGLHADTQIKTTTPQSTTEQIKNNSSQSVSQQQPKSEQLNSNSQQLITPHQELSPIPQSTTQQQKFNTQQSAVQQPTSFQSKECTLQPTQQYQTPCDLQGIILQKQTGALQPSAQQPVIPVAEQAQRVNTPQQTIASNVATTPPISQTSSEPTPSSQQAAPQQQVIELAVKQPIASQKPMEQKEITLQTINPPQNNK